VSRELTNYNWIRNLRQVNSEYLLDEFFMLYTTLSEVHLNDVPDSIFWRWMPSGEYTTASAYDIQFLGAYLEFRASSIWRALSAPKYRFFAWLALLRKAPTANNLALKGWPCNPSCALCYCETEMIDHVLTECNFAKAVWDRVAQEFQVHVVLIPFQKGKILDWIAASTRISSKRQQRINAGIVFFYWWLLWKERN
jgi:hypothetical protein